MAWHADDTLPTAHAAALPAVGCFRSTPRAGSGLADAAADPGPAHELELLLGLRLRRLRHERRWSLDRLSAATGVSRAMLGQIELGKSVPTVRVLLRIAAGLGVDVAALLAFAQPTKPQVSRAAVPAAGSDTASIVRALGSDLAGTTAFHAVQLPPGGTAAHPDTARHCRVSAVVARGTVEVTIDGETLTLGEHDAVQVETTAPLHWRNAGDATALIHAVCARDG
jgi:transcriptional regulator with XRE-family HTH domain